MNEIRIGSGGGTEDRSEEEKRILEGRREGLLEEKVEEGREQNIGRERKGREEEEQKEEESIV